jgi:hypothetical protein
VEKTVNLLGFKQVYEPKKHNSSIYSVWITTAWQHISPGLNIKGFNKCCISSAINETDVVCCGMAGILRVSGR